MKNITKIVGLAALAALISGCGASSTSPSPNTGVSNVAANVLQFAVGTANLYGGAQIALNVVVTYRQPSGGFNPGDSGTLLNSPTLTIPAAITGATGTAEPYDGCSTAGTGPSPTELATTSIGSTSQAPGQNCVATQSTFGQSGGAFGSGLEPYNAMAAGDFTPPAVSSQGKPFQTAPYPVPLYSNSNPDPQFTFTPWLGPPSFNYYQNTQSVAICNGGGCPPAGYKGWEGGIDVFSGIPATAGSYTLSVNVPASTGQVTTSKSATLTSTTPLGTATAPSYTPDGSGGGTFAFTMPAGATEAIVEITDFGPDEPGAVSCNGSGTGDTNSGTGNGTGVAVYYTIAATASGTLTLPDTIGPKPSANAAATPSVCTAAQNTAANGGTATDADQITIQTIGFDYPYAELSYPASLGNPTPTIVGAAGQDDITISTATCRQGTGACVDALPLAKVRRGGSARVIRRRP